MPAEKCAGPNEPPICLRKAEASDRDVLLRIYASTRAEELKAVPWTEEQKAAFCLMQFEAQDAHYRQHYPTAEYQVIVEGGNAVGRLYVDRWAREIRIMDIALLEEHRGRGLGTRLLEQLQGEARSSGKALSIHVEKFNPALRWYQRLGFAPREDKGVYLLMEWRG